MSLLKAIISGQPGTGKTSLLCSAANAGYTIIRAAFEPGEEVFDAYCTAAGRANIHNYVFEDDWECGDEGMERKARGMTAFERFVYTGRIDKEYPEGKPADWGPQTIVAVDTLTSMGECAETRALKLNPLTREGRHLWAAAQDQENICEALLSRKRTHHTVVLAHLRLIAPKAESGYKDETELQKQVKRERAQLEDTGYYPTAVTPGIARNFVGHFPFALLTETDDRSKHASGRVLRTKSIPGYQVKCPLPDFPDKLPVETGLVLILDALKAQG